MSSEHKFSVIIPALNEAETIGACISGIKAAGPDVEVIVVDGGSRDGTAAIAKASGAAVLHTFPCRGLQCNLGAVAAAGELLVFLHADTQLPDDVFSRLSKIFESESVKTGNFGITFDPPHRLLRFLGFLARFDPGFFRFGDQGLVIRKTLFDETGGFPNWELFEDMAFTRRVRKRARIYRFPMSVTTSSRRYLQNGTIRQTLINIYYIAQYQFGVPPWRLAEKYWGKTPARCPSRVAALVRMPLSGKVKTRLAKTLGDEKALKFYRDCAEHLLRETEKLASDVIRYVYYTPASAREEMQRWVGPRFFFRPQAGGDIGRRLEAVFREEFRSGAERVVVVASDVPDLKAAYMEEALASLGRADMVIGPSTDGGYYLIGLKEPHPSLFKGIRWSSGVVYDRTLRAAHKLGLKVHSLRTLDDIDTGDDLLRWQKGTALTEEVSPPSAGRRTAEKDG